MIRDISRVEFDAIIIGTSPILLIEGLMRARCGQKLLFVESGPQIGGVWGTTSALGLSDIEGACHLMVNYCGAYKFLEEHCFISMSACEPAPQILLNGRLRMFNSRRRVAMRAFSIAIRTTAVGMLRATGMGSLHRRIREFSFSDAFQSLADHGRYPIVGSVGRRAIRYPDGGASGMLRSLCDQLKPFGCLFTQGTVDGITITDDSLAMIQLESGRKVIADEVILSESGCINWLQTPSLSKRFSSTRRRHTTLILEVSQADPCRFSYLELPEHAVFDRIADLTAYCSGPLTPGHRILIAEMREPHDDPTIASHNVISTMQDLGLMSNTTSFVDSDTFTLETARCSPDLRETLRARAGDIPVQVIPSRGDFSLSLLRNQPRWESFESTITPRYGRDDSVQLDAEEIRVLSSPADGIYQS